MSTTDDSPTRVEAHTELLADPQVRQVAFGVYDVPTLLVELVAPGPGRSADCDVVVHIVAGGGRPAEDDADGSGYRIGLAALLEDYVIPALRDEVSRG